MTGDVDRALAWLERSRAVAAGIAPPAVFGVAVVVVSRVLPAFGGLYAGMGIAPPALVAQGLAVAEFAARHPGWTWALALGAGSGLGVLAAASPGPARWAATAVTAAVVAWVAVVVVQAYAWLIGHGP